MSAGVYSSDTATSCFAVRATAEPGTLSRLIEVFAKRGLVPTAVHVRLLGPEQAMLAADIQVPGLEPAQAEIIAEQLRAIVSVERVLLAEMLAAAAA